MRTIKATFTIDGGPNREVVFTIDGKVVQWDALTYNEQAEFVKALAGGYRLFYAHLRGKK